MRLAPGNHGAETNGGGPVGRSRSTQLPKRDPARSSFARTLVRPSLLRASLIANGSLVPGTSGGATCQRWIDVPTLRLLGTEDVRPVPEPLAWLLTRRPDFAEKGDER
jgi:hypothetical protein